MSALIRSLKILPVLGNTCNVQIRTRTTKHWNPKFRKLRGLKFVKVDLPKEEDLDKAPGEITREEIRSKMKERGILPGRPWSERPMYISATGTVFEPYVPPEGDGKVSSITRVGAKQKLEYVEKKSKSMMALRKIRSFEDEFEFDEFLKEAQDIYINAHQSMVNKDRDKLPLYVTERAYPEVVHNIGDKTLRWRFLESIEPPKVVHVRCLDVITKTNIFSQITVRFHSRQILAVYDRFGRLMHGNENLPKDVLEYVVFEKHLASQYGKWRIHDKIIPSWMPPREPSRKTYLVPSAVEKSLVQKEATAPAAP